MLWELSDFNSNIAVIDESGHEYTYADLLIEGNNLVRHVGSGRCLIFNLCANEFGSLLGYISFVNNRIVPLLLDAGLDRALLDDLIANYQPDYLWVPQGMCGEFPSFEPAYTAFSYTLLKTPYTNAFPLYEDLALLLTTSGSTGSPKLVRQSYDNIRANTESIVEYLRLSASERPITTMPMSYTYGLSIINSHLYVGASVIMTQYTLMQKEFWNLFKTYGATSFGGVPYIYEMLDKLRFFRMDLPSLRTMTQAGGKLSPELHKKFAEYAAATGRHFVVMYGQTEATARMAYLPPERSIEKYGSMGIAIPGGHFSLIDTDDNEITESGIVGELVYQGPNVTLGYAECGQDLSLGDERNGVLVTGDMARRDEDGFYYIVGRKKRFLKIFGSRINLDETERMIQANYREFDCACGGIDDKMYVFITDHSKTDDVRKFLANKTGLNHIAFNVQPISMIPRNESGKIQYKDLQKYYESL